jgi:hypothetical protein
LVFLSNPSLATSIIHCLWYGQCHRFSNTNFPTIFSIPLITKD